MLTYQETSEAVRVTSRTEENGAIRVFIVGGDNVSNADAAKVAIAMAAANGISRGGYVTVMGCRSWWRTSEYGVSRLHRELLFFPKAA